MENDIYIIWFVMCDKVVSQAIIIIIIIIIIVKL